MSTVAYRASLVREIEQAMKRLDISDDGGEGSLNVYYDDGQRAAYAHILTIVGGMEDQ